MKNRLLAPPAAALGNITLTLTFLILCIADVASEPVYRAPLPGFPATRNEIRITPRATIDLESTSLGPGRNHLGPIIHSLAIPQHPLLSRYLAKYQSAEGARWLEACLTRGAPYRKFIAERIAYHDVPPELAYLPIIESAFYPNAVSRSGAVGLWQFMMNSIGPFGMEVNEWQDDRRDFWKSTDAALRKLKENYDYLGDWLLAIGAYNCGLGCMSRAVKKAGTYDFWALADGGYLPTQTVNYVPKFLAVAHVASYAGRYGIELKWDTPFQWARIPVEKAVSLRMLADASGIPLEEIAFGNAELKQGITPPASYYLKVADKYTDPIVNALEDDGIQLMSFRVHPIRTGDTLYALSKMYAVPLTLITQYNPGIKPDALRIGEKLIIPLLGNGSEYVITPALSGADMSLELDYIYTVQQGDTLWAISQAFGTIPEVLAMGNNLKIDGVLPVGTTLRVPQPPSEEPQ